MFSEIVAALPNRGGGWVKCAVCCVDIERNNRARDILDLN